MEERVVCALGFDLAEPSPLPPPDARLDAARLLLLFSEQLLEQLPSDLEAELAGMVLRDEPPSYAALRGWPALYRKHASDRGVRCWFSEQVLRSIAPRA